MAKKGGFRSSAESKKWEYLEATTRQSMDRIQSGTATKADYEKTSRVLGQQSKLAQDVFDNAVEAMELAAKKTIAAIEEDREKKGKEPLTEEQTQKLLELALKRAFDDFGPELVETLDTLLTRKLDEQDELTGYRIDEAVDKIKDSMPKPIEEDPQAKIVEEQEDAAKWEKRLDQFTERAEKAFKKSIIEVAQELRDRMSGQAPSGPTLLPALGGPKKPSLLERLRSGLIGFAGGAKSRATSLWSGLAGAVSKPINSLFSSSKNESDVVQSTKKQTSFLGGIQDMVKKFMNQSKALGKSSTDKMKAFFKGALDKYENVKGWLGDKLGKVGSAAKTGMGWLSTIGTGLLAGIMYSPLLSALMDKVGSYFSKEAIVEKLGQLWEWMKKTTPEVLGWVWDKVSNFDYKGLASKVWEWIKGDATTEGDMMSGLPGRGALDSTADAIDEKADAVKKSATSMWDGFKNFFGFGDNKSTGSASAPASEGGSNTPPPPSSSTTGAPPANTAPAPGNTTQADKDKGSYTKTANSVKYGPDGVTPINQNSSTTQIPTTNVQNNVNIPGSTRSVPAQSVSFAPGIAAGVGPLTPASGTSSGNLPPVNRGGKANVMGLGSFGLVQGVDDTLGLMNLGVLT